MQQFGQQRAGGDIGRLEQVAEATHRRLVGHRLAAEIDPDKAELSEQIRTYDFDQIAFIILLILAAAFYRASRLASS